MDRPIIYPGQVQAVDDVLNLAQFAKIGLGSLINAVMGSGSTVADGLSCSPGSGLSVVIGNGSITANGTQQVDPNGYSTLPASTATGPGQYQLEAPVTVSVVAGATNKVYATLVSADVDNTLLPYYDAANTGLTLAGANNNGVPQPTVRTETLTIGVTQGSIPTGAVALWDVTLASGATSVTAANIAADAASPFLNWKLPSLQPVVRQNPTTLAWYVQLGPLIIQAFTGPGLSPGAANTQQTTTCTFPVPFPNACLWVGAIDGGNGLLNWNTSIGATKTGCTVGVWSPVASTGIGHASMIAVGC